MTLVFKDMYVSQSRKCPRHSKMVHMLRKAGRQAGKKGEKKGGDGEGKKERHGMSTTTYLLEKL